MTPLLSLTGAAQEQQHRIAPEIKRAHDHEKGGEGEERDPIKIALQQRVTSLQGFNPMHYLTSFDWGKESSLGGGRTLREYKIAAKDINLEIAPGIFFPGMDI